MNPFNSKLPSGWLEAPLGKVLPFAYGKGLTKRVRNSDGDIAVYGSSGIVGCHSEPLVKHPTIVVGRKGSVGAVYLSETPSWPIDTVFFSDHREALNLKFFAHQLRYMRLGQFDQSTAIPSLSRDDLHGVTARVAPRPEQQRIVAEIEKQFSRLDAGVAALRRVEANLKRYKAAVLKAACTGALTADWRAAHPDVEPAPKLLDRILRQRRRRWEEAELAKMTAKGKPPKDDKWKAKYTEPEGPVEVPSFELPRGWLWTCLGQCFSVHVGATPSRKKPSFWNGDIPWVSSGEVQFCRINQTRELITADGLSGSSTQLNPRGSVILNMIGEGRTRGKAGILDIDAANNQNCAAIWVSQSEMLPEFVYYWLQFRYEDTRRVGSGNNQPALNKTRVERLPLPLPPVMEQEAIVAELGRQFAVLDVAEATLKRQQRRSNRLRQSILKDAFEGKLVEQDPTDEPASALLARIAAEREKRAAQSKPKRRAPRRRRGK